MKLKGIALCLGIATLVTGAAHATLLGDTVDVGIFNSLEPGINRITFSPALTSVVVGAGPEVVAVFAEAASAIVFDIDISGGSLQIDVNPLLSDNVGAITVHLEDLDWVGMPSGEIVQVVRTSLNASFPDIVFTADSLDITFAMFSIVDIETFTFDIIAEHGGDPIIPEPATMTLMGLGLAGFALRRRKMKA